MKTVVVLLACLFGACAIIRGLLLESMTWVGGGLGFLVIALILQGVGGSNNKPKHPLHRDRLRDGLRGGPW